MDIAYVEKPFETRTTLLSWQEMGLQQTRSGYGRKLTTSQMIKIEGEKVWRRVYAICYSNVATHYILMKGEPIYLRSFGF